MTDLTLIRGGLESQDRDQDNEISPQGADEDLMEDLEDEALTVFAEVVRGAGPSFEPEMDLRLFMAGRARLFSDDEATAYEAACAVLENEGWSLSSLARGVLAGAGQLA